jgi:hypothetical protein
MHVQKDFKFVSLTYERQWCVWHAVANFTAPPPLHAVREVFRDFRLAKGITMTVKVDGKYVGCYWSHTDEYDERSE